MQNHCCDLIVADELLCASLFSCRQAKQNRLLHEGVCAAQLIWALCLFLLQVASDRVHDFAHAAEFLTSISCRLINFLHGQS